MGVCPTCELQAALENDAYVNIALVIGSVCLLAVDPERHDVQSSSEAGHLLELEAVGL